MLVTKPALSTEVPPSASASVAEWEARREDRAESQGRDVSRFAIVVLLVGSIWAAVVVGTRHGEVVTLRHGLWLVVVASFVWALAGRTRAIRAARWATWRTYYVALSVVTATVVLLLALGLGWIGGGSY